MLKKLLVIIALFGTIAVNAQEGAAVSGAYGLYVYCGNTLLKKTGYVIQRSESGKSEWKTVGTTRFPTDSAMLFASYAEAASLNAGSPIIDETEKSRVWKLAQGHNTLDSLGFYAYFPAFRQAVGIVLYDTTVVIGKLYDYKITLNDAAKGNSILINKVSYNPALHQSDLKTVYAEPYEDKVMLRYFSASGYVPGKVKLYRQYYLQGDFKEVPAVFNAITEGGKKFYILSDANVKTGLVYNYFAVPIDVFGNPGTPTDTVRLTNMVQAHVPAVQMIRTSSDEKAHAIKLYWRFATAAKFLKSVNVYRSESYDTTSYDLIGTVAGRDTLFMDKNVDPVKTYYYFIKLNGDRSSGNPSARVPGMLKADRRSPAPLNLQAGGEGDKVMLSWSRPSADTRGYYLYRSENDTANMKQVSRFIPISGKNTEVYTDTISTRGKHNFFYIVRAENTSYAKSNASNFATANIALSTDEKSPVTLKARATDNAVMLYWPVYTDQNEGMNGYHISRKKEGSVEDFKRLNKALLLNTQNYFEDSTAEKGKSYVYQLEVIKKTGNSTAQTKFSSDRPKTLSPGGIVLSRNGQDVTVVWDATTQENVKGYKIYQLDDQGNPVLISTITGKEKSNFSYSAGNAKVTITVVATGEGDDQSDPESWVSI